MRPLTSPDLLGRIARAASAVRGRWQFAGLVGFLLLALGLFATGVIGLAAMFLLGSLSIPLIVFALIPWPRLASEAPRGVIGLLVIVCLSGLAGIGVSAWLVLAHRAGGKTLVGRVTLDGRPLQEAIVMATGVAGAEWPTDRNGVFRVEIPDNLLSDSITLSVHYRADFEERIYDTTVAKTAAGPIFLWFTTGPTHSISGWVVEEGNGQAIPGAELTLAGERGSGRTDSGGYFRFSARGRQFEQVQISVSHPDYEPRGIRVVLGEGQRITLKKKR